MLASIQASMIEKYSFLEPKNVVGVRNYIDVVEGMDAGFCRGGIMSGSVYREMQAEDEDFCATKSVVGEALMEVPYAIPSSDKFVDALNYVIQEAVNKDQFEEIYFQYETELIGQPICESMANHRDRRILSAASASSASNSGATRSGTSLKEEDGTGSQTMTIAHMLFPLFATFFCTTVGLIVFFYKHYQREIADWYQYTLQKRRNKRRPSTVAGQEGYVLRVGDKKIKDEVERLSVGELVSILSADDAVLDTDIDKALDKLPDSGALVALLYERRRNTQKFKELFHQLQRQSVSQIYRYLLGSRDQEELDEALASVNPKTALIDLAMNGMQQESIKKEMPSSQPSSMDNQTFALEESSSLPLQQKHHQHQPHQKSYPEQDQEQESFSIRMGGTRENLETQETPFA